MWPFWDDLYAVRVTDPTGHRPHLLIMGVGGNPRRNANLWRLQWFKMLCLLGDSLYARHSHLFRGKAKPHPLLGADSILSEPSLLHG